MSPKKNRILDVRALIAEGTEPFPVIRAFVDNLQPDESFRIVAPFMPAPLIELLKSEGFQATMEHRADGAWAVNFWKG